ncbi:DUF6429 family protein [Sporolactobacillus vineae]|uniref:DUF6429 family protein n=1 Tax=Sporolactobacillus vineae TaxID=444463 RepID=UPI000474BA05|nr:DUF6429 family protein [Sporolactobacillus vineae]
MTQEGRNQQIKDLTLILLYLTSWEEAKNELKTFRSWKGYNFNSLNELEAQGLISGSRKSKSVYFSDEGINKAKKLLQKYRLED